MMAISCLQAQRKFASGQKLQGNNCGREVCLSLLLVGFPEAAGGNSTLDQIFGQIQHSFSYVTWY